MSKYEVLTTSLANQTRIRLVAGDILANLLPDALEYLGRSGEVETCHAAMAYDILTEVRTVARNEVDNTCGHTSLHQDLHEIIIGQNSS